MDLKTQQLIICKKVKNDIYFSMFLFSAFLQVFFWSSAPDVCEGTAVFLSLLQ